MSRVMLRRVAIMLGLFFGLVASPASAVVPPPPPPGPTDVEYRRLLDRAEACNTERWNKARTLYFEALDTTRGTTAQVGSAPWLSAHARVTCYLVARRAIRDCMAQLQSVPLDEARYRDWKILQERARSMWDGYFGQTKNEVTLMLWLFDPALAELEERQGYPHVRSFNIYPPSLVGR